MASILYEHEDPRPFLHANLRGQDSYILVGPRVCISVTVINLPLTNKQMHLQGISGRSLFTQSLLIPLIIYPFEQPFCVQFWVGQSQVGMVMGMDILSKLEADVLLTRGQLISQYLPIPIPVFNKTGIPKLSLGAITDNEVTEVY